VGAASTAAAAATAVASDDKRPALDNMDVDENRQALLEAGDNAKGENTADELACREAEDACPEMQAQTHVEPTNESKTDAAMNMGMSNPEPVPDTVAEADGDKGLIHEGSGRTEELVYESVKRARGHVAKFVADPLAEIDAEAQQRMDETVAAVAEHLGQVMESPPTIEEHSTVQEAHKEAHAEFHAEASAWADAEVHAGADAKAYAEADAKACAEITEANTQFIAQATAFAGVEVHAQVDAGANEEVEGALLALDSKDTMILASESRASTYDEVMQAPTESDVLMEAEPEEGVSAMEVQEDDHVDEKEEVLATLNASENLPHEQRDADAAVADGKTFVKGKEHLDKAGEVVLATEAHKSSHDVQVEGDCDVEEAGAEASVRCEEHLDTAEEMAIAKQIVNSSFTVCREANVDVEAGAVECAEVGEHVGTAPDASLAASPAMEASEEPDVLMEAGLDEDASAMEVQKDEHVDEKEEALPAMNASESLPHEQRDATAQKQKLRQCLLNWHRGNLEESGIEACVKSTEHLDKAEEAVLATEAHETSHDVQAEADDDVEAGAEATVRGEEQLDKAEEAALAMEVVDSSYDIHREATADVEAGAEASAEAGEHARTALEASPAIEAPKAEAAAEVGAEATVETVGKMGNESPQHLQGQAHKEVVATVEDQVHREIHERMVPEADVTGNEESEQLTPEDEFVSCSDGVARCEATEEEDGKLQETTGVAQESLNVGSEMVSIAVSKDQLLPESPRGDTAMLRLPTPGRSSMGERPQWQTSE